MMSRSISHWLQWLVWDGSTGLSACFHDEINLFLFTVISGLLPSISKGPSASVRASLGLITCPDACPASTEPQIWLSLLQPIICMHCCFVLFFFFSQCMYVCVRACVFDQVVGFELVTFRSCPGSISHPWLRQPWVEYISWRLRIPASRSSVVLEYSLFKQGCSSSQMGRMMSGMHA